MTFFVGTAGWTVPKQHIGLFTATASGERLSHLDRHASRLHCVEINSSFHRPHLYSTWERWAATTPAHFRFALKAPKVVTHTLKLVKTGGALLQFFEAIGGLGNKLGPVLFQLPPKLAFDEAVAQEFFTTVRELYAGAVVLEPRHPGWFGGTADRLLGSYAVGRVAADPPKGSDLAKGPGGWPGIAYWRLHGAPRTYYSNYEESWLQELAVRLLSRGTQASPLNTWVIFDNTALGHAAANAIWLHEALVDERAGVEQELRVT